MYVQAQPSPVAPRARISPVEFTSSSNGDSQGAGLVLHGGDVAQFRMPYAGVVKALGLVEGIVPGAVNLTCRPFGLQRREEAFQCRFVPHIASPARLTGHALPSRIPGFASVCSCRLMMTLLAQ